MLHTGQMFYQLNYAKGPVWLGGSMLAVMIVRLALWSAVLHFFTEDGSCIATETFELSQKGF